MYEKSVRFENERAKTYGMSTTVRLQLNSSVRAKPSRASCLKQRSVSYAGPVAKKYKLERRFSWNAENLLKQDESKYQLVVRQLPSREDSNDRSVGGPTRKRSASLGVIPLSMDILKLLKKDTPEAEETPIVSEKQDQSEVEQKSENDIDCGCLSPLTNLWQIFVMKVRIYTVMKRLKRMEKEENEKLEKLLEHEEIRSLLGIQDHN